MAVSKKRRFEIFRRDRFSCRYCGLSAMNGAVLEVDHVIARANGGSDAPTNLVTACEGCNSGKSDTPLDAPTLEDVLPIPDGDDESEEFPPAPNLSEWVEDLDTCAAIAWSHDWVPGPHEFGLLGVSTALAVAAGYRGGEILAASEAAGAARDHDLIAYLPKRDEPEADAFEEDVYREALRSLGMFVPAERIRLIWHARVLAGDYQPTVHELIRAAAGVGEQLVEHGRDLELLQRYLRYLPNGEGSQMLVRATAEWDSFWNGRAGHAAHECSGEVLELAVSFALQTEVPV